MTIRGMLNTNNKLTAFIAVIAVITMVVSFITYSHDKLQQVDTDRVRIDSLEVRMKVYDETVGEVNRLNDNVKSLNENLTQYGLKLQNYDDKWEDFWKYYEVKKK